MSGHESSASRRRPRRQSPRRITPILALLVGTIVALYTYSRHIQNPIPGHFAALGASVPTASAGPRQTQAGQPIDPLAIAAEVARAHTAGVMGDRDGVQRHAAVIKDQFARSLRMPDPARRIDPESARAAVRPIPGVRSAIWMDPQNLLVMVDGAQYRQSAMIDQACLALQPLGDTLAIVVNVQDVSSTTRDGASTISRNCQLPEGQRAFLQAKRQVDAIAPELRETFKAQQRD
ncbi:MAG: hypothetical protein ABI411_20890 [Tahibacter sp.]